MLAYAGRGRLALQTIDLARLVMGMARLLQAALSKHTVMRFEHAPRLPAIEGDPTQLRQVIMNLLTNAAEAIQAEGGVVTVRTSQVDAQPADLVSPYLHEELPTGSYVALEVADTGCGMDEATLATIFDPFFTLSASSFPVLTRWSTPPVRWGLCPRPGWTTAPSWWWRMSRISAT